MTTGMNIAFFGSATCYRGVIRALAARGHQVTFYEPDAHDRQDHRDIEDRPWAKVVVYPPTVTAVFEVTERARGADLVVKASGGGVHDSLLERAVLGLQGPRTLVAFWDVDAPATLARVEQDPTDPFRTLIPSYDLVLTHGGGAPVTRAYERLGARRCVPIYSALDPATHHPVPPDPRFSGALGFLGNRLPDRERRVEELFLRAAAQLPHQRFLLAGAGWEDKHVPSNVTYLGQLGEHDHDAFSVTPLAVLDISRDALAAHGGVPATRVFEAAGAGACLITEPWTGLEQFLAPGTEVLVATDGTTVAEHVAALTPETARAIGERARSRMLREHTYAHRALDVEAALGERARATGKRIVTAGSVPTTPRTRPMSIVILGLSITSSWGNGHATTYRGLVRELCARGHEVLFLERDVPWYADNRDLAAPPYARASLYADLDELRARFETVVRDADLVIVGSYVPDGIAVGRWVLDTARGTTAFYDLDTPITLSRLATGDCEYLERSLVPRYGMYLSFTGGPTLTRIERELGSPRALPLYCSVDPALYGPEVRTTRWDLGYMGTYSADRQRELRRLMLDPARAETTRKFVVAGPQYPSAIEWPPNVERIDHLAPSQHRAFYNEMAFTLNVTRSDMVAAGWSPSVRLFEAAACGVPIITDAWPGLEELFEPDAEILIAHDGDDVLRYLRDLGDPDRRAIGARACARVRGFHTAAHRAAELERYVRS